MSHAEVCPVCKGTGKYIEAIPVCHGCEGKGWITVRDEGKENGIPYYVTYPPYYIHNQPLYTPPIVWGSDVKVEGISVAGTKTDISNYTKSCC